MRDHSNHIELTREEAISRLIEAARFAPATEVVDVHDAHMRVTAEDCSSIIDVPNALCAQMDGIAVRFEDFEKGTPDTSDWQLGVEFDWANTGTALPAGFDTVIAIESVRFDGGMGEVGLDNVNPGRLEIFAAPERRGDRCREAGATFEAGQALIPASTRLTPTKLSALAMCGYSQVNVVAKPRVVFIPTGDELVSPGRELPAGKAYDSNGILLEGKLRLWGAEPVIYECIPDDWNAIRDAILKACAEADIVAINAGSSKGAKDFTMEILEEIGTVICHETNHGPGRHTSASVVNGKPVLGLSGPPGGCEITADWYLKPLVDSFLYGHGIAFSRINAIMGDVGKPEGSRKAGERDAVNGDTTDHGGPNGPGGPANAGAPNGASKGPGGAGKGPGENFFAIRPVRLEHTVDGVEAVPVSGGPHPDLLKLDEADGYLEMHPFAYRELKPGDEVTVELRYPYTAL